MLKLLLYLALTYHAVALPAPPQQECTWSADCGQDECRTYESGRFVCEPRTYSVMVWDSTCISKLEKGLDTTLEAPLVDGKPDMRAATAKGVHATYDPKCGHIEVRHR